MTRIVPQKQNDTLHLTTRPASRCHSRASSYAPIQTAWDTRSIATQTSQEEEQQQQQQTRNDFFWYLLLHSHLYYRWEAFQLPNSKSLSTKTNGLLSSNFSIQFQILEDLSNDYLI